MHTSTYTHAHTHTPHTKKDIQDASKQTYHERAAFVASTRSLTREQHNEAAHGMNRYISIYNNWGEREKGWG
jgi:ClpP class serine protease